VPSDEMAVKIALCIIIPCMVFHQPSENRTKAPGKRGWLLHYRTKCFSIFFKRGYFKNYIFLKHVPP